MCVVCRGAATCKRCRRGKRAQPRPPRSHGAQTTSSSPSAPSIACVCAARLCVSPWRCWPFCRPTRNRGGPTQVIVLYDENGEKQDKFATKPADSAVRPLRAVWGRMGGCVCICVGKDTCARVCVMVCGCGDDELASARLWAVIAAQGPKTYVVTGMAWSPDSTKSAPCCCRLAISRGCVLGDQARASCAVPGSRSRNPTRSSLSTRSDRTTPAFGAPVAIRPRATLPDLCALIPPRRFVPLQGQEEVHLQQVPAIGKQPCKPLCLYTHTDKTPPAGGPLAYHRFPVCACVGVGVGADAPCSRQ